MDTNQIKYIMQSNISNLNLRKTLIRSIQNVVDEDGEQIHKVFLSASDTVFPNSSVSGAWFTENLLLFTLFNEYLENKYQLMEGASFKNHYDNLPEDTNVEKIVKSCYRIMKLIRNAIQHNLNNLNYTSGNYDINYCYHNTMYRLKIGKKGIDYLNTIVVDTILEQIIEIPYKTNGHFDGIMNSLYLKLFNEIQQISDDIPSPLLVVPNALKLKPTLRYIIENPRIIAESETTITFSHVENNMIADENDMKYIYSQDYIYKNYLLPQEIGRITWGKGETLEEQITEAKICFNKKLINDKWKIR